MKRIISIILTLVMVMSLITIDYNFQTIFGAEDLLKWNKNDTMDTSLQIIPNKTGSDDILLDCLMASAGNYTLEYFLEEGRKTTVTFQQQYDQLVALYMVEEMVAGVTTNITQDLLDITYLEMDYTASVPDWKYIANKTVDHVDVDNDGDLDDVLKFTINRNASSQYNGMAFQINDKKVYFNWDFQMNSLKYQIFGYEAGNIMPVTYTNMASNSETIKILKGLEDFEIRPTHYIAQGAANIEPAPIVSPGNQRPGQKPGLQITFVQPKELDGDDWTYSNEDTDLSDITAIFEFSDIASSDYLDFNIKLQNADVDPDLAADFLIAELPDAGVGEANNGVVYQYTPATHLYTIDIVQDKSTLNDKPNFIQWSEIKASKIYNANINFQKESGYNNYEFVQYMPVTNFAYTYMDFELNRANMSEAYLDILPYDASSGEEIEYTIMYSKTVVPELDPEDDLWVKHYYSKEGTTEHIYIPVPFKQTSSQDVYQIQISFAGVAIKSQVYNYRAKEDDNVPLTTPKIKEVDKLYVVPSEVQGNVNPSKAQFDLVWTAPENRNTHELDTVFANEDNDASNDHIYYEVLVNDVPHDTTANPYKVIKVFEVYKDGNAYKMRKYESGGNKIPVMGDEKESEAVSYDFGYNSIDELFRMENITIYENGKWAPELKTEANLTTNQYTVTEETTQYDFEYPGINYIRIRAITEIDGSLGVSYMSIPNSLSLSPMKYDIPIVEGLKYSPINGYLVTEPVGLSLNFHSVDISTYIDHMLFPVDKKVIPTGLSYDVYISQNSASILELDPSTATEINMDDVDEIEIDPSELQRLRNNEVLYFNVESNTGVNAILKADIIGLDRNTNYFIRIVAKVDVVNEDGSGSGTDYRYSDPSVMLSTTTPVVPQEPDDGEVKPLAVENFDADFLDEAMLGARLMWDYPDEITFAEDMYAFEVVGIEDMALPSTLSSSGIDLEDMIDSDAFASNPIKLWRIMADDGVAELWGYNFEDDLWEELDNSLLQIGDHHIEIIDPTNKPNKVYYYYVRCINVAGGTINSKSPWTLDTLTTAPVKAPINLTVAYNSGVTYNAKTESVIRFDAPIPTTGSLTTEYIMEIYIKGEEDADYTMIKYPTTFIKQTTEAPLGYVRLYYRIAGLKSGNAYSVKVRIEDRTKLQETLPDGSLAYPRSPFSDRTIIRTEFDQTDYDKRILYQQYLDYYDSKVKELTIGDYFVIETTNTKNVVKYRDKYSKGSLTLSQNGEFNLYTVNVATNVFYLPANFIENMNVEKVTLRIQKPSESVYIRPYSLGKNITTEITNKVKEIQNYSPSIVDYYVKITVESNALTTPINLKTPASNQLSIKVEVVGSTKFEDEMDALMLEELGKLIIWKRDYLEQSLSDELDLGIDEKKLLKIAQDAVADVRNNYRFSGDIVLRNNLQTTASAVAKLAKTMTIAIKPSSTGNSLDFMKKVNTLWQKQASTATSSYYQLDTMDVTSYLLLPQTSGTSTLSKVYTEAEINLINQYQLTDVFDISQLTNPSVKLNKYQIIPVLAKLLAMPAGSDAFTFLKEKGISITDQNLYGEMTRQEILYLYTQVFAKKYNIVLSTAKITNYNMIKDYSSISANYQQTLLIGANTYMFDLINEKLLPMDKMSVPDFIKVLVRMNNGLTQ